jgi:hypothetical protein
MSNYFKKFPKTDYMGKSIVNIAIRSIIIEDIINDPFVFLPYTINEGERPEDVAFYYYGDAGLVWLILFANNIIDTYTQWPLSQEDFYKYIIKKYKEQSNAEGYAVIAWTKNETITDNIVYYQNKNNPEIKINPSTYNLPTTIQGEWRAIRYYEYEDILNENKRNIFLIDNRYAEKFESELENVLNDD